MFLSAFMSSVIMEDREDLAMEKVFQKIEARETFHRYLFDQLKSFKWFPKLFVT